MTGKKTFLFFCGWAEALADFSPTDRCAVYDATIAYAEDGTLPKLSPVLMMAFRFIKTDIDDMKMKYEAICERNRENARKRWQKINATVSDRMGTQPTESEECECMHSKHKHKHEHEHEHEFSDENIIDKEKEKSKKKKQSALRFTPPTVDDVAEYAKEKGYGISAERFISYYESVGWRVGRNPMKDWRAAVRTWATRDKAQPTATGGQRLGIGEYVTDNGVRTYGSGRAVIPQDAPPRPSERHQWSAETNTWIIL